jgi:hypothetical protein
MAMKRLLGAALVVSLIVGPYCVALHAKEDVATPKEYGVYVKMKKTTKRLLPNIVFEEKGLLYVESNNPAQFPLAEVELFIIYGKYDIKYLTFNPMLFVSTTALGKSRFLFGKELELEVAKKNDLLHTVKPKSLLGRGYYSLWINDTAWDFVIE